MTGTGPSAGAPHSSGDAPPSESDWGLAAKKGVSRETLVGLALVFVLLAAFGFVVYQKWDKRRADAAPLAADAPQTPAEQTPATGETAPPPTPAQPAEPSPLSAPPSLSAPLMASEPPLPELEPVAQIQTTPAAMPFPPQLAESSENAPVQTVSSQSPAPAAPEGFAAAEPVPPQAAEPVAPPPQGLEPQPATAGTADSPPFDPFPPTPTLSEPTPPAPLPVGTATVTIEAETSSPLPMQAEPTVALPEMAGDSPVAGDDPFAAQMPPTPAAQTAAAPTEAVPVAPPLPEPPPGLDGFFPPQPLDDVAMEGHPLEPAALPAQPLLPEPADVPSESWPPPGAGQATSTTAVTTVQPPEPAAGASEPFMSPVPDSDPPLVNLDATSLPPADSEPLPAEPRLPVTAALPVLPQPAAPPSGNPFAPPPAGPAMPAAEATPFGAETATAGATVHSGDRPAVYEVRPHDNFWTISRSRYGTARYYVALARYNSDRIPDATKMRPGMKVLIPTRESLEARFPDLFPHAAHSTAEDEPAGLCFSPTGEPLYRVGSRDTLGEIARKHLGRASRWGEIFELNRERIAAPDALKIGTVLRLPPDASRVRVTGGSGEGQ